MTELVKLEFAPDFLPPLPNRCPKNSFTRLEVTADGSVVTVLKTGMGAARKQDGVVANQEDVRDDGQFEPRHGANRERLTPVLAPRAAQRAADLAQRCPGTKRVEHEWKKIFRGL